MTAIEILERRVADLERKRDAAVAVVVARHADLRIALAEAKRVRGAFQAAYSELQLARSTAAGKRRA